MSMTIRFETTGVVRSGIAKQSGNEYHMAQAFLHIPGIQFPQMFDYYCARANEVLPVGSYECDVTVSIKDGRPHFEVDPRQARRISTPAAKPVAAAS